jgi:hypothetical protein
MFIPVWAPGIAKAVAVVNFTNVTILATIIATRSVVFAITNVLSFCIEANAFIIHIRIVLNISCYWSCLGYNVSRFRNATKSQFDNFQSVKFGLSYKHLAALDFCSRGE